jgi:hypothetical protein
MKIVFSIAALMCCSILAAAVDPGFDPERESRAGHLIVDLYEEALASLTTVTDDYRRIRAMRLSQIRDIPFSEAFENIDSVMPELTPINRGLLRQRLYDPSDIIRHKTQVAEVRRQIETMIDLVAILLLEIEKLEAEVQRHLVEVEMEQQEVMLEEIVAQEEFDPDLEQEEAEEEPEAREMAEVGTLMEQLIEAARDLDDEEERFSDLTELMNQIQPQPIEAEEEETEEGEEVEEIPDIEDLTETEEEEAAEGAPRFVQEGEPSSISKVGNLDNVSFTFGRKVLEGGEPVEWMFVDTWYVIGPFPNPSRANIDRQFPPETIIDLNASYVGKDGREVQWEFHQTGSVVVRPTNEEEYGIWYYYTELYFDRPMDLWIATGSDDRGDIWLNDLPIWVSSDKLKGWRVDEGFRKVAFRQGVNRILYRLENGWIGTGLSFGIYLVGE